MKTGLNQTEEETKITATNHTEARQTDSSPPRVSNRRMKLGDLLKGTEARVPAGAAEMEIRQVACDSRKVKPRALFFALHGAKADGNAFMRDAVGRGAVAIASEDAAPPAIPESVAWIQLRE